MPEHPTADTAWNDDEIVMSQMTPDTVFIFDRMTEETIAQTDARPGERILDVACGRAIDARTLAREGAALVGVEASEIMIGKALELLGPEQDRVRLVRAFAENLPFADQCFDKTICKGAMDHFADLEQSMAEMARVTRPGGRIIIAIANFESLTCRLGKAVWGVSQKLTGRPNPERPFWEPPEDHNYKFDLAVLKNLMSKYCEVEKIAGLSLLWGFPKWGMTTRKMPPRLAGAALRLLDRGARLAPSLSDVLVAAGRRK